MLIASDGVWEFIDSAWCVKALVKKIPTETSERICEKLAKEARKRWKQEEDEYCDDITMCFQKLWHGR
jgi:serine/threonine protein phosphatase PrpC